jgi:copper transport protein
VTTRHPAARGLRGLLAAAALALCGLVATAAPASAHAGLEQTAPQQGAEVSTAPSGVTLTFSEAVSLNSRSVQVLDPAGHRVDRGNPRHPDGRSSQVTVDLAAGLPKASYAVVWHVVSADSHPVSGTFSFGLGVPAGAVPDQAAASPTVGGLHAVFRGTAFAGAVLLLGGLFFLVMLWPQGLARTGPRRTVAAGWVASTVAAVALFLLQGPYGAGLGLGGLLDPALASETLSTRYGKLVLLRLVVLAFAVVPLRRLGEVAEEQPDQARAAAAGPAGLAAVFLVTFSLSEHAGQGGLVPLWAGLDAVHLAAVSIWVGGLAVLGGAVLGRGSAAELAQVLPGWSRTAMAAVAGLVVTGTLSAWHQVGTLAALTGTEYGKLVLGKAAGLVLLLVLAEVGRRTVRTVIAGSAASAATAAAPRRQPAAVTVPAGGPSASGSRSAPGAVPRATDGGPPVGRLRIGVIAELAIAAVVLAITTVLVNTVPAEDAFAPPFSATVVGQGNNGEQITVLLDVDRTKPGATAVHVYTFAKDGQVLPFVAAKGSLVERAKGLGPVNFELPVLAPGHGSSEAVVVPSPGTWTLTVQIRTDETTDYSATASYPVR